MKEKGVGLLGSFFFEHGSIKARDILKIVEQGIGFEADRISIYPDGRPDNDVNKEELLSILASDSYLRDVTMSAKFLKSLRLDISCKERTDLIRFTCLQADSLPPYFDLLPTLSGFTIGHLEDRYEFFWQNTDHVHHYEFFKKPYDHLRVYKRGSFDLVDISLNPGRNFALPGMDVTSCWRMWFGGKAFGFFPRSRLLAFDKAHRIEELPNGVVFIELYEDPTAFDLPENRERQRAFREWMKFDEIEANAPELLAQVPTDPIYEMEWLDKKTLRCMTWLDDDLKHVRRSKATQRWVGIARDNWPIYEAVEKPPYRDWQENQE